MANSEEKWLVDFLPFYERARPIVQNVGKSVRSGDDENIIKALNEGVQKLPDILKMMKAIQNPRENQLKSIKKEFEKGFSTFIDSCKLGITYFNKPTVFSQTVWLEVSNKAAKQLEEATTRFSEYANM